MRFAGRILALVFAGASTVLIEGSGGVRAVSVLLRSGHHPHVRLLVLQLGHHAA